MADVEGAEVKGLGAGRPRIERPELDASLKGPWVWDGTWKGVAGHPAGPGDSCHPSHRPGGFRGEQPPLHSAECPVGTFQGRGLGEWPEERGGAASFLEAPEVSGKFKATSPEGAA